MRGGVVVGGGGRRDECDMRRRSDKFTSPFWDSFVVKVEYDIMFHGGKYMHKRLICLVSVLWSTIRRRMYITKE